MAAELYRSFENILVSLGLGSPLARGTMGAALFSVPIFMHWGISYDQVEEGIYLPKKWSLFAGKEDTNTTGFPWFIWPILGYALFSLFL